MEKKVALNIFLSVLEAIIFTFLSAVFSSRYKFAKEQESYQNNRNLRMIWKIQILHMSCLTIGGLLWSSVSLTEGRTSEVFGRFRSLFGIMYPFLLCLIELFILILVIETNRKSRRKSNEKTKYFFVGVSVPIVCGMVHILQLFKPFNNEKDPSVTKLLGDIAKVQAFAIFMNCMFCFFLVCYLVIEFQKLINYISGNPITKEKHRKLMKQWKIFLILNMITTCYMVFIHFWIFYEESLASGDVSNGKVIMSLNRGFGKDKLTIPPARYLVLVIKIVCSGVLVFFAPHTNLKVRSKRDLKTNKVETK